MLFWDTKKYWGWLAIINLLLGGGLALLRDSAFAVVCCLWGAWCAYMAWRRTE